MLHSPGRSIICVFSVLLCTLLLVSCGGTGNEEGASEWTVAEGAATLDRDLFVSEGEDFYFGEIPDVDVASDGRMYVLDWEAYHVKVLAPDGTLRQTIGRKGEGPGEFEVPRDLVVARGDSLYVLDSRRSRISVFTPTGAFAYSVQAEVERTGPTGLMVPPNRPGFLISYDLSRPGSSEDGSFVVSVRDATGEVADTLLTARARDMHPVGPSVSAWVPFGRVPHVAMGPDGRVQFGRSDSLGILSYDLDGTRRQSVAIPFEAVPVTDEDRERRLEQFQSEHRPELRGAIPSTKPAFTWFLVDDEGRYWFGRPTADPDSTSWWVAWPNEKRVATTRLPSEVRLTVVRDGHAYGHTIRKNEAPALVRYRVRFEE